MNYVVQMAVILEKTVLRDQDIASSAAMDPSLLQSAKLSAQGLRQGQEKPSGQPQLLSPQILFPRANPHLIEH
jgi:hypothetical protein